MYICKIREFVDNVTEMPTIKANINEACLREYNPTEFEMPDIALCMIPSMPSVCVKKCRETREGAKGGKCEFGEFPDDVKCFCNYCFADPTPLLITKPTDA